MSEEWPNGWYRDEGSPSEPTHSPRWRFALKNPVTTMVPFGGFGNTSAGSVVEWDVPEAKVFFNDLATYNPLPKNLITGASVAGTT